MRRITIDVPDELAAFAETEAARTELDPAGLIAELLRRRMLESDASRRAMESFFSRGPYDSGTEPPYPAREALYDRDVLR